MMSRKDKSFYDIKDFPKLQNFCEKWKIIQREYYDLNAPIMDIHRIDKEHDEVYMEMSEYVNQGNRYGWVLGWGEERGNNNWLQYGLIINDQKFEFITNEMKKTLEMCSKIEGIKVCALVKMKPSTILHTHQHSEISEEGLLQLHLTIDAPTTRNYNYINVNGEFRQHNMGEPIVFDGSLDHFALNSSFEERTILYMEFDRNMLLK